MEYFISTNEIIKLCSKQLSNFLTFDYETELNELTISILNTLEKIETNFAYNKNKYYSKEGKIFFNPFHSGQYSIFLYYLSNDLWKQNKSFLADKVYYLNKILHSVDMYYEIELPDIFVLDHPVGSVLGRAEYSDYFSFAQNCTVGNNKGIYPTFEEKVSLLSGSKVIGNSKIESNVIISANSYIKDTNIPKNSIVFGQSPNLTIKGKSSSYFESYFEKMFFTKKRK